MIKPINAIKLKCLRYQCFQIKSNISIKQNKHQNKTKKQTNIAAKMANKIIGRTKLTKSQKKKIYEKSLI